MSGHSLPLVKKNQHTHVKLPPPPPVARRPKDLRGLTMTTAGFYEIQLLGLAVICVISLSIDRYVAGKSAKHGKESADERLESGKSGSASALAALTRKYLVVYGIVMGEFCV